MTLNDQQILDIVNEMLAREHVRPEDRVRRLRESAASRPALQPVIDRYLAIMDPPRTCQVEHDHWEGPMMRQHAAVSAPWRAVTWIVFGVHLDQRSSLNTARTTIAW